MRVLLINTLYPPFGSGGAERSVWELAQGLAARGVQVAVATLCPPGADATSDRAPIDTGVAVYRWRPPGPWPFGVKQLGLLRKLSWHFRENYRSSARSFVRSVLEDFVPDVVHTNNIAGFGVAILRDVQAYAWVHTLRDYYLLCPRTTMFRRGRRCGGHCMGCKALVVSRRPPARAPDMVVGVSRSILDKHQSMGWWGGAMSTVVHNRPIVHEIPRRWIGRIQTVGFIGRFDDAKGASVLLRAFSSRVLAHLTLVVAGPVDDGLRPTLNALVEQGRVELVGVLPAERFYDRVDLVVVPSQWDEPFGRVAAEAGDVGLPVLVSRRGGLVEAVSRAERCLIVESPEEPGAWSKAVLDAVSRWSHASVGGRRPNAEALLDEPYVDAYEKALNQARAHATNLPKWRAVVDWSRTPRP